MELGCVHWDRRDWGWECSFMDSPPPTSLRFTFMLGFSPAEGTDTEAEKEGGGKFVGTNNVITAHYGITSNRVITSEKVLTANNVITAKNVII
jgi:hypothetical protein